MSLFEIVSKFVNSPFCQSFTENVVCHVFRTYWLPLSLPW